MYYFDENHIDMMTTRVWWEEIISRYLYKFTTISIS